MRKYSRWGWWSRLQKRLSQIGWSCNLCFAETTVCFVFVFWNGLISQMLGRGQRFLLILHVWGIAFSSQVVCGPVLFIGRTRGTHNSQKKGPGRPLEKPMGGALTESWFLSLKPSVLPLCPKHGILAGLPHCFPPFCPSFSYVEDWQAFPVESQTVNIRFCEPFGLCHNSPAGPLLHESSQTHKQMADGCVPIKLNLSTLNCTFHDTLRVTEYSFIFFLFKRCSIYSCLYVYKSNLQT